MNSKTYHPTQKEIKREWHVIDAKGQVLGRIASRVATLLMGKNKSTYSPHMDSGDYVVVVNAEKFILTGNKTEQKVYRSHSGYPGGFKELSFKKVLSDRPEQVIEHAISGMLPENRLKADRMARLKVVVGESNPYEGKTNNG